MPVHFDLDVIRKEMEHHAERRAFHEEQRDVHDRTVHLLSALIKNFGGEGLEVAAPAAVVRRVASGIGRVSKKGGILAVAREMLAGGASVPRTAILEECIRRGVLGDEKKPMNRLATVLWEERSEFESDGRGSYRLRATSHVPDRSLTGSGLAERSSLTKDVAPSQMLADVETTHDRKGTDDCLVAR